MNGNFAGFTWNTVKFTAMEMLGLLMTMHNPAAAQWMSEEESQRAVGAAGQAELAKMKTANLAKLEFDYFKEGADLPVAELLLVRAFNARAACVERSSSLAAKMWQGFSESAPVYIGHSDELPSSAEERSRLWENEKTFILDGNHRRAALFRLFLSSFVHDVLGESRQTHKRNIAGVIYDNFRENFLNFS